MRLVGVALRGEMPRDRRPQGTDQFRGAFRSIECFLEGRNVDVSEIEREVHLRADLRAGDATRSEGYVATILS